MTNFDYLKSEPQFHIFADVAISAERIIHIDPEACIINCRRSMEFAIKWMYSIDQSLVRPYQDNLSSLMHTEEFKDIVDETSGSALILSGEWEIMRRTPVRR